MSSPASHAEPGATRSQSRIAAVSLAVTICLLVMKLAVGIISDSVAVLSDAVDSGTDLVGGAAALISVQIASRPADESHQFGHGKVEALSAAVAATIVGVGGGVITYQAARRLVEGAPEIDAGIGLAAMTIAAGANVVTASLMRREARRSGSMALAAESTHLQTNVMQAMAIIAGLVLVLITDEPVFDALTALALAAYMGWAAIGLVNTALTDIMDASLPDEEQRVITDILQQHEHEIRGYHRLRTRRSGATRHVDMHLAFEAGRTVEDVHVVADAISDAIHKRLPGTIVVIHAEPDHGDADGLEGAIVVDDEEEIR